MHEKISLFMVPFIRFSVSSSLGWQDDEVADGEEERLNRSPLISRFRPSSIWTLELILRSFQEWKQWGKERRIPSEREREMEVKWWRGGWWIRLEWLLRNVYFMSYLITTLSLFSYPFPASSLSFFFVTDETKRDMDPNSLKKLFALFMRKLIHDQ